LTNFLSKSVPYEVYSRNALYVLILISTLSDVCLHGLVLLHCGNYKQMCITNIDEDVWIKDV